MPQMPDHPTVAAAEVEDALPYLESEVAVGDDPIMFAANCPPWRCTLGASQKMLGRLRQGLGRNRRRP
jgi:hypothetical protein